MKRFLVLLAALAALTGCGNQKVNTALQVAQVQSESAQATFHMLATAASSLIPLLPADQQATKRDELTQLVLKGDQVFQAEEDAIRAAILANAQTFDVAQFAAAIAAVMDDLLKLSAVLGVRPDVMAHAQTRVTLLRAQK